MERVVIRREIVILSICMTYFNITVKYNVDSYSLIIITFFKDAQKKFNILIKKKEA